MLPLLYFALAVLTSPALADATANPVTVSAIHGQVATLHVHMTDGSEPSYDVPTQVRELPLCARIVGAWLACESIGFIPPPSPRCYLVQSVYGATAHIIAGCNPDDAYGPTTIPTSALPNCALRPGSFVRNGKCDRTLDDDVREGVITDDEANSEAPTEDSHYCPAGGAAYRDAR